MWLDLSEKKLGTRKEAHKYLLEFRKAILKDPTSFQEKSEILRKNLDELETRYRDRNWFATGWDEGRKSAIYKGENKLKLDSKETGIIELLQAANFRTREETIKTWRASLEERTKKLFKSNIEIKKLYESSSDYFRLKKQSIKEQVSKKTIFCIETINNDPSMFNEDIYDWQKPSEILLSQKDDQIIGSINLLTSWGSDKDSVERYLEAVEKGYENFKKGKKVAIGAAIVAGAVLTYKAASRGGKTPIKKNPIASPSAVNTLFSRNYLGDSSANNPNSNLGLVSRTVIKYPIPYSEAAANELGFLEYIGGFSNSEFIDLNCLDKNSFGDIEKGFANSLGLVQKENRISGPIKGSDAELYLHNHKKIKTTADFSGKINNRTLEDTYNLDLVHTGPRGGKYRVNKYGRKAYDIPKN